MTAPLGAVTGTDATARLPASSVTSRAAVPAKIGDRVVSATHTAVPAASALPHALAVSSTSSKNSRNSRVKPEWATIRNPFA